MHDYNVTFIFQLLDICSCTTLRFVSLKNQRKYYQINENKTFLCYVTNVTNDTMDFLMIHTYPCTRIHLVTLKKTKEILVKEKILKSTKIYLLRILLQKNK